MRKTVLQGLLAITGALAAGLILAQSEDELANLQEYRVTEFQLRSRIIDAPAPVLPQSYRPAKRDLVVAQVELAADGSLRAVSVLETPSAEVGRAVQQALRTWRFASFGATAKGRFYGKLTFYLVPDGRATRVFSPFELKRSTDDEVKKAS